MPEETVSLEDTFLQVKVAAKILNMSNDQIRRLARAGTLPAYQFGTAWRIRYQDLLDYIQNSKIKKEE